MIDVFADTGFECFVSQLLAAYSDSGGEYKRSTVSVKVLLRPVQEAVIRSIDVRVECGESEEEKGNAGWASYEATKLRRIRVSGQGRSCLENVLQGRLH